MGRTPIPVVQPRLIGLPTTLSEDALRSTLLWRFSRHKHRRERAYEACRELIRRAELELGITDPEPTPVWEPHRRPTKPPPKPSDALQSVTPPRPGGVRPSTSSPGMITGGCGCIVATTPKR